MEHREVPWVGLLGAVSARRDGVLTTVPGRRARSVLAALALEPGRVRAPGALIEDVWGADPPRDPVNALHTQISRLRPLLPGGAIEASPAGYRLTLGRADVDLSRAQDLAREAERAHRRGASREALESAAAARGIWRGEAGADLRDCEVGEQVRGAAEALASALERVHADALLADGQYEQALPELRERSRRAPLDEPAHAALLRCLGGLDRGAEALAVYEALRARLAESLGADPSEELAALHLALLRGELGPAAPAPTESSRPTGLRAGPNPLLGREQDIDRLGALLAQARVVTILGPGGMGKTRLASHLGLTVSADLAVALVELAGVRAGADVLGAVTSALGLSEVEIAPERILRARGRDVREVLRSALSARATLLILDNCEQVVAACADLVADLVAWCPELTVLTTSRTPLQISAEAVYPLPPLRIDEAGSPATELFTARARAVRPTALLDPSEVARLCRALDGLPLAIELAAARVRTLSVEQINSRLADRFALLRGADRSSPERHRTLHAVIDWSWDLLAVPERGALRRLCGFPGGFTGAAAAAVVGGAGRGGTDVDAALEGLVNQSLLEVTETDAPVGVRYHMLETVREYGQERQAQNPGEAEEVARLRARWAAGLAAELFGALAGGDQAAAMATVESELENLLDALRWSVEGGEAALALPLYTVLGLYWSVRGAHSEAGAWAVRVLEACAAPSRKATPADPMFVLVGMIIVTGYLFVAGDRRGAARARTQVRRALKSEDVSAPMRLLGEILTLPGDPGGLALGRLLARGVRSADPAERCLAHLVRANILENAGNRRSAVRDTARALELAHERGDVWGEGMAAQMLGQLSSQVGHYEEAIGHYRRAAEMLWGLRAYEESAQIRGVAAASLVGAGRAAEGRREALAALEVSAVLASSSAGSGRGGSEQRGSEFEAAVTSALAEADLAEGQLDHGLERYLSAVGMFRDVGGGDFGGQYAALITAAAVCAHAGAGRLAQARALLAQMLGPGPDPDPARQHVDVPINGSMLMAIAAVEIADAGTTGAAEIAASPRPARALGLAIALVARQDYPSLRHERWTAAARLALGDEVVAAELKRAGGVGRRQALAEMAGELRRARQALRI